MWPSRYAQSASAIAAAADEGSAASGLTALPSLSAVHDVYTRRTLRLRLPS